MGDEGEEGVPEEQEEVPEEEGPPLVDGNEDEYDLEGEYAAERPRRRNKPPVHDGQPRSTLHVTARKLRVRSSRHADGVIIGEIPVGETRTYSQLARAVGSPKAVRALGHANGRNPISIIVPCHRLVGSDGALRGYAGGLDRKRWLLDHEQRVVGAKSPKH